MFTADNHLDSQPDKRRRTDASSLGQPLHTTDNHLDSQPEKRRRTDASSLGQPPLPKPANKVAAHTLVKTSSTVATGPTQSPPLTSTTPSTTPLATQTSKSTSTMKQATTKSPPENLVNTNMEVGDLSSLKQSQSLSTPLSTNRELSLPDGDNEPVLKRLSSADHIPSIDDKQVMLPPKQVERDVANSATGDYEPHLDEALWTGVDVADNVHKQKGSGEDLPEKKSAKLTAMVSLSCGTSTGATRVFVTIANNGLDTRFEVTQDGSES